MYFSTSAKMPEVFRLADLDAIFTAHLQITHLPNLYAKGGGLEATRTAMIESAVESLFRYRDTCAKSSPASQLILPESLKLMPLYTLGALKCLGLRQNKRTQGASEPVPRADERSCVLQLLETMPPVVMYRLLQPQLFSVEDLGVAMVDGSSFRVALPLPLVPSAEHLADNKALLLDAGVEFFLWLGSKMSPETLEEVSIWQHLWAGDA